MSYTHHNFHFVCKGWTYRPCETNSEIKDQQSRVLTAQGVLGFAVWAALGPAALAVALDWPRHGPLFDPTDLTWPQDHLTEFTLSPASSLHLHRTFWTTSPATTWWCLWLAPSCCSRWSPSTPCWATWCGSSWWGRYLATITPGNRGRRSFLPDGRFLEKQSRDAERSSAARLLWASAADEGCRDRNQKQVGVAGLIWPIHQTQQLVVLKVLRPIHFRRC